MTKPTLTPKDYGKWERLGWSARFFADGKWVAWSVGVSAEESKRLKKAKKPAGVGAALQVVDFKEAASLASATRLTLLGVQSGLCWISPWGRAAIREAGFKFSMRRRGDCGVLIPRALLIDHHLGEKTRTSSSYCARLRMRAKRKVCTPSWPSRDS
ncbi:MAG: hypothetical protein V3W41_00700 [Planctomycetota bacterium]